MAEQDIDIAAEAGESEPPTWPSRTGKNIFSDTVATGSGSTVKNYSKVVRRKIYFLFAMLALVIILMNEAKKPEHWQWMGFESQPDAESIVLDPGTDLEDADPSPTPEIDANGFSSQLPVSQSKAIKTQAQLQDEFLEQTWDELKLDQQTGFIDLLSRCAWSSGKPEQAPNEIPGLSNALSRFVAAQHDDVAISSVEQDEKTAQRKTIDEFAQQWNDKLLPAFESIASAQDITMSQQIATRQLVPVIDRLVGEQIEDLTTAGRKTELPAWLMFWRRVQWQTEDDSKSVQSVSTVELRAQPESWRGKPVTIRGNLLSGRKIDVKSRLALDDGHYFEWWIADRDGDGEIYCLYTTKQPQQTRVENKWTAFDRPVKATGYFYKIRSYIDTKSEPNYCPLILGRELVVLADSPTEILKPSPLPSMWVMAVCLAALATLAFGIARWVDRDDRRKIAPPGGKTLQRINENLEDLEKDPDIKSVAEQMKELQNED